MTRAKLIVAASENCADMLYATRFRAPDPFAFIETNGHRAILLNDLEVDRGRQEAVVDEVVAYSALEKLLQGDAKKKPSFAAVVAMFIKRYKTRRVVVPEGFSLGTARALKKEGIRIRPVKGMFWPQRELKTPREIKALRAALQITEAGMARAIEVLKSAVFQKNGYLSWSRRTLTSEILRVEIETAILRAGGEARGDSIVACGEQGCDPHNRGSGPLRANELIILDIFPRNTHSGYFGDLTRTVIRGKASEAQKKLWETCLEGQQRALKAIKPRASGLKIHESIKAFFADQGYPTEIKNGRWQGFFHGTGHGLGLEIHEPPSFAAARFRPRQVFTVEPGIYLPGIGGVRHEDVIVVTKSGNEVLSRYPKMLEI